MAEFSVDAKGRYAPRRPGIRYALTLLLSMLLFTACGGSSPDSSDLPPIPPTMTVEPEPTMEPTPLPEGDALAPLEDGQKITADDLRYAIQLPEYWVRRTAPLGDIAFRESGGTPENNGFTYSVARESLPVSIQNVEDYAEHQEEQLQATADDVTTLSVEPVQIAGIQGVRAQYTLTRGEEVVLVHQVYLVDGETGFVLTGNAPHDGDTDAARDLFNRIAGSFSFPRG